MTRQKLLKDPGLDFKVLYDESLRPLVKNAPWILRVTDHRDRPSPVMMIKERKAGSQKKLKERGAIYGPSLKRTTPIIRSVLSYVTDGSGIPLDLGGFLDGGKIEFRGNIPLDDETGYKLALIFKLQERIKELDRVELLARRVARFSREEGAYWFSRITDYGSAANRWARTGMKILLAGQPHDPQVSKMLDRLRLE